MARLCVCVWRGGEVVLMVSGAVVLGYFFLMMSCILVYKAAMIYAGTSLGPGFVFFFYLLCCWTSGILALLCAERKFHC